MLSTFVHMGTFNNCDLASITSLSISFCWISNTRGNMVILYDKIQDFNDILECVYQIDFISFLQNRMEMDWMLVQEEPKLSSSTNTLELSYPF